jgi:hypothetical protein
VITVQVIFVGKQELVFTLVMLIYIQHLEIQRICLFFIQLKLIFWNGVGHGFRHQQSGARTTPACAKLVLLTRQTFIMDQVTAYAMQATKERSAARAQHVARASTRQTQAMACVQIARRTRTTC